MDFEQITSLEKALAAFLQTFRPCFKQDRSFAHLQSYSAGLVTDLKRKSIEPIALAAGVDERTLQWFLSNMVWDHARAQALLHRQIVQDHPCLEPIGVIDSSGHPKSGKMTPGVQRQWCGQSGKNDNCVVGQHLLYTDNDPRNPFSCMLASDLFLPESWSQDRDRCRKAGVPDEMVHRTKWQIAIEQLKQAVANGIRFSWVTFDEEYGTVPQFWFALDRLGLNAIGEVQPRFNAWATPPICCSGRAEHSSKRVDHLATYSPVFTKQPWKSYRIKIATRGKIRWKVKWAMVQLVEAKDPQHRGHSTPTDRRYWLIIARNAATKEVKYFVSNAPPGIAIEKLLEVAWARWHVEKWFERAKQEVGLGAFEVRTYTSLMRHWLICRMAMLFLAAQTKRLRGEKSEDHVRTGGPGRKHSGLVPVESLAPFAGELEEDMRLLSVA